MRSRRRPLFALHALFVAAVLFGCNYKGEDTLKEKDFAVSATVKTAVGAAGSSFVHPIMTRWIAAFERAHPDKEINYRPIGSAAGWTN